MYKSYVPYLQHILDECLYVRSVIKDDMQREEFLHDETLRRAVTRSLSIIGEALHGQTHELSYHSALYHIRECDCTCDLDYLLACYPFSPAGLYPGS